MRHLHLRALCCMSVLLVSVILVSSSPPPTYAQSPCGTWQVAMNPLDSRIGAAVFIYGSGTNCRGAVRLSNGTGLPLIGGGYALEMHAHNVQNATFQWVPMADLLPSLDIELHAVPNVISSPARVYAQGDMTLRSLTWDASLFLLRTALALDPIGISCVIPEEQLVYAAIRVSSIVGTATSLASSGDSVGARQEFSQTADEFYTRAGEALRDVGIGCAFDGLKRIAIKPAIIAKIGLAFVTWAPVAVYDYFKYQGQPVKVRFEYAIVSSKPPVVTQPPPPSPTMPPSTQPPPSTPQLTYYNLANKRHSSLCLGVQGNSQSDGAFVEQRSCSGSNNQLWGFQDMGGGYYQIVAKSSGKCMTVQNGSQDWAALIVQWTCSGADHQLWRLIQVGGYYQIAAKHSGQCIDEDAFRGEEGLEMQQWPCGSSDIDNQLWQQR